MRMLSPWCCFESAVTSFQNFFFGTPTAGRNPCSCMFPGARVPSKSYAMARGISFLGIVVCRLMQLRARFIVIDEENLTLAPKFSRNGCQAPVEDPLHKGVASWCLCNMSLGTVGFPPILQHSKRIVAENNSVKRI